MTSQAPHVGTGSRGVVLLDTENLFASFGWQEDWRLKQQLKRQLKRGTRTEKDANETRVKNAKFAGELARNYAFRDPKVGVGRAGLVVRSLVEWSGLVVREITGGHANLISFGYPDNGAVRAVQPSLAALGIERVDAMKGEDQAELALIDRFNLVEADYEIFVFGGRDYRMLDAVINRVEAGWKKNFVYVFPPDARGQPPQRLEVVDTPRGKKLNDHPGAVGTFVWGRFYEFLDEVHRLMTARRRTQHAVLPIRAEAPAVEEPRAVPPPWTSLALAALEGRLPRPRTAAAFDNAWIDTAAQALGGRLSRYAAQVAFRLNSAREHPAAAAELVALDEAPGDLGKWSEWSAAALMLPRARDLQEAGKPAVNPDSPLVGAVERASAWLALSR